jgi:hypothetical protein
MGIAVYPRLGELLEAHRMTVAELERQIEARFGLSVDTKTLYRLTHPASVQRADLEIAGAAATVLGVGLDDIFEVRAQAADAGTEIGADDADLPPALCRRLSELFDRQSQGVLTPAEREEMEALVAEFGRRLHEHRLKEIARERGIAVEEARTQVAADLDRAIQWWRSIESDPRRRRAIERRAHQRRRAEIASAT